MINILFITAGLHSGGAERQLINLIKGLDKTKFKPILVIMCREGERVNEAINLGIEIKFILRRWRWDIFLFQQFVKLIKKGNIHIVHTWGMMPAFYILLSKPFVTFIWVNSSIRHTLVKMTARFFLARILLKLSDYRVANSYSGLRSYGFIPSKRNLVIYNGIFRRETSLSRDDIRIKFNLPPGKIVTSAGRLEKHKDFIGFLHIAMQTLRHNPNYYFVIAGSGSMESQLKKKTITLGIEKNIIFTGFVYELHELLSVTDVFILLSTPIHGEGIANSIAEAMSFGIPVIGSNSGGNSELIEDQKSGFIFHTVDFNKIPYKVIELLTQKRGLAQEISENARRRIEAKFSFAQMISNYQNLYLKADNTFESYQ